MPALNYIKYFSYIAINWNLRIAAHILINEIKGEKKYGIYTTGADELKDLEEKGIDISHATIYMPASYDLLELLFTWLKKEKLVHLLDIGCGKGRALCVGAHYNYTMLTGIDFSKELCKASTLNLQLTQQKFPALKFEIINNDAFYFEIPPTVDCIFLFNPFDEIILHAVIKNIEKSLRKYPRKLFIIYINPMHKTLFTNRGFAEVFYQRKWKYLEACILTKK